MPHFEKSSLIHLSPQDVYDWHTRPHAFYRLIPPWERVDVVAPPRTIENGSEVITRMKIGPTFVTWVGRHYDVKPGFHFCDELIEGPFKSWKHRHKFEAAIGGCRMIDAIDYELPLWPLSAPGKTFVESKLRRLFDYRHTVVRNDLSLIRKYSHQPKKILITGGTGLIGSALIHLLRSLGHKIIRLARNPHSHHEEQTIRWNFEDPLKLEKHLSDPIDAVIHLAGESIAANRWSDSTKRLIAESRKRPTKLLSEAIARLPTKPQVFISASATGYYPSSDTVCDEEGIPGDSFLSQVCIDWEASANAAREAGIRTLHPRIGIVLTPAGGALAKMILPFQAGLGSVLGDGKQFWSWISIDDLLYGIVHCLETQELSGPINFSSPMPITNQVFSETLASVLNRRLGPRAPKAAVKLMAGEMADELLFASRGVKPKKLLESGFNFSFPDLDSALRHTLGRLKEDQ